MIFPSPTSDTTGIGLIGYGSLEANSGNPPFTTHARSAEVVVEEIPNSFSVFVPLFSVFARPICHVVAVAVVCQP